MEREGPGVVLSRESTVCTYVSFLTSHIFMF